MQAYKSDFICKFAQKSERHTVPVANGDNFRVFVCNVCTVQNESEVKVIYKYKNKDVFIDVSGNGKAVFLLHGWGCTHDIFKVCKEILSTQYEVFSFDLPGFGSSQEPEEVWGVEEYTRLIEQFAIDNRITSPALVGHSFGGRISILYSSRNKTDKVVLIDSAGIKPKRSWKYYYKVYTYKCMKWLLNTLLSEKKAQQALDKIRKNAGSSDYNNASPMMRRILSKVVNEDLKSVMPQIEAPVLLFWGDRDTATPLSDAKYMEKHIKDAGLVIAHGTGHFSFLENPLLFAHVLKNFFRII